ncbi:hypothetical protein RQP46_003100 [Phenoliferia psychrophenolica]
MATPPKATLDDLIDSVASLDTLYVLYHLQTLEDGLGPSLATTSHRSNGLTALEAAVFPSTPGNRPQPQRRAFILRVLLLAGCEPHLLVPSASSAHKRAQNSKDQLALSIFEEWDARTGDEPEWNDAHTALAYPFDAPLWKWLQRKDLDGQMMKDDPMMTDAEIDAELARETRAALLAQEQERVDVEPPQPPPSPSPAPAPAQDDAPTFDLPKSETIESLSTLVIAEKEPTLFIGGLPTNLPCTVLQDQLVRILKKIVPKSEIVQIRVRSDNGGMGGSFKTQFAFIHLRDGADKYKIIAELNGKHIFFDGQYLNSTPTPTVRAHTWIDDPKAPQRSSSPLVAPQTAQDLAEEARLAALPLLATDLAHIKTIWEPLETSSHPFYSRQVTLTADFGWVPPTAATRALTLGAAPFANDQPLQLHYEALLAAQSGESAQVYVDFVEKVEAHNVKVEMFQRVAREMAENSLDADRRAERMEVDRCGDGLGRKEPTREVVKFAFLAGVRVAFGV